MKEVNKELLTEPKSTELTPEEWNRQYTLRVADVIAWVEEAMARGEME
jgi:hypothetical protein